MNHFQFFTLSFPGRKHNYANKCSTTSSNYTIFVCLYFLECKVFEKKKNKKFKISFLCGKISVFKKELVKKKGC